ncbi:hypothetical protein QAD02_011753 [Eretmocerus hayati]|uniref:Uncharacterized protein n=1 Tax=Eretmocerus hayati TaxID=131215 RepID=A0ACC2NXW6_9HYME|nr:hypothetical protein QAD02_011753 [Eretmocerus hayati]
MDEAAGAGVAEPQSGSTSSSSSSSNIRGPLLASLVDGRDRILDGKRALYTYRAEYKRLPLYQFGLGKRRAPNNDQRGQRYSFGLGKRTREYQFGLGKRSNYGDVEASRIGYDVLPSDYYDAYPQRDALEEYLQGKRSRTYDFGVGKRLAETFHERSPTKQQRDKFAFGLGKRYDGEGDNDIGDYDSIPLMDQ